MANHARVTKVRYPAGAVLAVAGATLLFVFDAVVGFLFMALVPPLIPVYVTILFACGCLVRSAVDYAVRVSVREPAAMLRLAHDEEARQRSAVAPARAA
jgi:hypothetical protein